MFWKGNNRLWCRNKVFFGTSFFALFFTITIIIVNALLFFLFTMDYYEHNYSYALLIPPVYLHIATISFLWIASSMDPGIIPRRIVRMHRRYNGDEIFYRINNLSDNFRLKFWSTWFIFRPARASHWAVCDNCVLRWDHHCPWMGTCIGRRNFKYFYFFLIHISLS